MKKIKSISIGTVIVILLVILILPKLILNKSKNDDAPSQNPRLQALTVNGIIIKPKYLQNKIFSNGTLMSNEEVEVRSEITGKITQILFEEGRKVKKGELLVKINDAELQATSKLKQM